MGQIAQQLQLLAAEVRALRATPTVNAVTVRQLTARYADSAEAQSLADWQTERGRIAHIDAHLGERDAARLTMADVDDLRLALKTLAPATRNRVVARLTAALRWSVDRGHLSRYPLPRVKAEAERNERKTHRTEAEVRLIVAAMERRGRHVVGAMTATAFDGGLRITEACRLRDEQLDYSGGGIALRAAETKGKEDRVTVLSSWAADKIRALPRPLHSPFVFCSERGKPFHRRTVLRYYQEACDDAGIKAAPGERNWFHDNRAGFADKQVELGTPVPHLMRLGGWRDYRTMQRYLRKGDRDIAAQARARLEKSRRRPAKRAPRAVRKSSNPRAVDLFS